MMGASDLNEEFCFAALGEEGGNDCHWRNTKAFGSIVSCRSGNHRSVHGACVREGLQDIIESMKLFIWQGVSGTLCPNSAPMLIHSPFAFGAKGNFCSSLPTGVGGEVGILRVVML